MNTVGYLDKVSLPRYSRTEFDRLSRELYEFSLEGHEVPEYVNIDALPGSEPETAADAVDCGPADSGARVRIVLKIRPKADVRPVADRIGLTLPLARKRISYESYAKRFGADERDVETVVAFCREHRLQPLHARPGARIVVAVGTVADAEEAFRVTLRMFRDLDGSTFRSHCCSPTLPPELRDVVTVVAGLDNRSFPPHPVPFGFADAPGLPITQIARLYDFPRRLHGARQRIGIMMVGHAGIVQDDIARNFVELGIDRDPVRLVGVADGANMPGANNDSEPMLDVQVVGAVAPEAELLLYLVPDTIAGWLEVCATALHDPASPLAVFSISFPQPERRGRHVWPRDVVEEIDRSFAEAAVLGITVLVASGDGGFDATGLGTTPTVMFPASSPYVLAVGGTSVTLDEDGKIVDETVWSKGALRSGGGVSEFFPKPVWQAAANVPLAPKSCFEGRGVPDVSVLADLETGYRIFLKGCFIASGGTSGGTPLLAGLIALINEQLARTRRACTVGYITPLLYLGIGSSRVFRDIRYGDNGFYQANEGWDPCTGWGSPNGTELLRALCERS